MDGTMHIAGRCELLVYIVQCPLTYVDVKLTT